MEEGFLTRLLDQVDFFTIWSLVLMAIASLCSPGSSAANPIPWCRAMGRLGAARGRAGRDVPFWHVMTLNQIKPQRTQRDPFRDEMTFVNPAV